MKPIAIIASGMISSVGLNAATSCAAIRCAIDNFQETLFLDSEGEPILGAQVPLDVPVRGREKLIHLATTAIGQVLDELRCSGGELADLPTESIPVVLCLSSENRPGRLGELDATLLTEVAEQLNVPFSPHSLVVANGVVGGAQAIQAALTWLDQRVVPAVIVAGSDSLLTASNLLALERQARLLTPKNSNGLIPGEAGAAVLLGPAGATGNPKEFLLRGVGFGQEPASIRSGQPLRANGLSQAIRAALQAANCDYDDIDYRITGISGEQYAFKEASLAAARTMDKVKSEYDLWHPADCMGDVGSALLPSMLVVARSAAEKAYAIGDGVLFHCANDDEQRAAIVGRYDDPQKVRQHGQ
ncbi:MAG: hypothetical protein R3C53_16475 [Pirellulaceae bacterium]